MSLEKITGKTYDIEASKIIDEYKKWQIPFSPVCNKDANGRYRGVLKCLRKYQ
jgi:hypothetical protein